MTKATCTRSDATTWAVYSELGLFILGERGLFRAVAVDSFYSRPARGATARGSRRAAP